MSAVAGSLARANEILAKSGENQPVNYLIAELELSVEYSRIQLEGGTVLVELGEVKPEQQTGRFLRFKVLPLPDTTPREQPGDVPDLKRKQLDDSLVALRSAGISLDTVLLKFDPKANAPAGTVVSYEVKSHPTGQIEQILLVVAGPSPDAQGGETGKPAGPEKPTPEVKPADKPNPPPKPPRAGSRGKN